MKVEVKKILFSLFIILFAAFLNITANAASQALYTFKTPNQQLQFQNLTQNLRCLVCQNQNLAESDASLAKDLRTEIYQLIIQGENETDIERYMVKRYGNFILFKPPLNVDTYILWFGPFLLLLIGFIIVFWISRRAN